MWSSALKQSIVTLAFALCGAVLPNTAFAEGAEAVRSDNLSRESSRPATGVSGAEFNAFFSNETNYNRVYWNVMSWYGSTKNGCVAFASTALRFLGVNIGIDTLYNGERVSLLTKPFSAYLQNRLGWIRINSSKDLKPGDLVFTVDEPTAPGYPAHVFMHSGYVDAARTISWAVDNQDFTHERALAGDVKKDYSAFAYALRSPVE
jgi:hypothetical protein